MCKSLKESSLVSTFTKKIDGYKMIKILTS
uniref:Uncharacterized protein n=1 Tax=Rhizophora mucronata TaxID=61149 RepID=A0A2P2QG70_RHIMU